MMVMCVIPIFRKAGWSSSSASSSVSGEGYTGWDSFSRGQARRIEYTRCSANWHWKHGDGAYDYHWCWRTSARRF
jgi:hypothetical protein